MKIVILMRSPGSILDRRLQDVAAVQMITKLHPIHLSGLGNNEMFLLRYIFIVFGCLFSTAGVAEKTTRADHKIALVVGNSHYKYETGLSTPYADAQKVGILLRQRGFELVGNDTQYDLDALAFRNIIDRTKAILMRNPHTSLVIYYSGHGFASDGHNFLLPIDGHAGQAADAISVASITSELLRAGAESATVFLDSCRNESQTGGLTDEEAPDQAFVAFATGFGQPALQLSDQKLSPYTAGLLASLSSSKQLGGMDELQYDIAVRVAPLTRFRQFPVYRVGRGYDMKAGLLELGVTPTAVKSTRIRKDADKCIAGQVAFSDDLIVGLTPDPTNGRVRVTRDLPEVTGNAVEEACDRAFEGESRNPAFLRSFAMVKLAFGQQARPIMMSAKSILNNGSSSLTAPVKLARQMLADKSSLAYVTNAAPFARIILAEASEQGDPWAQFEEAPGLISRGEVGLGQSMILRAAESGQLSITGDTLAVSLMGQGSAPTYGIPPARDAGIRILSAAAEHGDVYAIQMLDNLVASHVVQPDEARVKHWRAKALEAPITSSGMAFAGLSVRQTLLIQAMVEEASLAEKLKLAMQAEPFFPKYLQFAGGPITAYQFGCVLSQPKDSDFRDANPDVPYDRQAGERFLKMAADMNDQAARNALENLKNWDHPLCKNKPN